MTKQKKRHLGRWEDKPTAPPKWTYTKTVSYEPPRFSRFTGEEIFAEYECRLDASPHLSGKRRFAFLEYRDGTYFREKAEREEFNSTLRAYSYSASRLWETPA